MKKLNLTRPARTTFSLVARGLILFFLGSSIAFAQNVWTGAGQDDLWSTNSNWSTPPPSQLYPDIVMLGPGHLVNTADTTPYGNAPRDWKLHSILFPDGAPNFVIHVNVVTVDATGPQGGITNNSGNLQLFEVDAGNVLTNTTTGVLTLEDGTVGGNVQLENRGGTASNPEPGSTTFFLGSAGLATINNFGGYDKLHVTAGSTLFTVGSTAANASIANIGGDSNQGAGGNTKFEKGASAADATVHNLGASGSGAEGGSTRFRDSNTRAGNATITNDGSAVNSPDSNGRTYFELYSSADHATVINNAGVAQGGETAFDNYATAGNALIINKGTGFFGQAGRTEFDNNTTGGDAMIVNEGGVQLGLGGTTTFIGNADAGNATLVAQAGAPPTSNVIPLPGGRGGAIYFNDTSDAKTAIVQLLGNGKVDISGHAASDMTIGSIEGDGQVYLGANLLNVGRSESSETNSSSDVIFYGSLHDGGDSGGTGGSLTKVGTNTLTLVGTSDYTGTTTVASGTLVIDGNIAASSGVTVDAGATLGGHGFVSSIGGAGTIAPGNSPGILTATQIDPTDGADFIFQMTRLGSPIYSDAAASGNDLLHLTGSLPFTSAFGSENQITIDFSGASLTDGGIYLGGFFTDASIDDAMVDGATFFFLGLNGYSARFDGFVTDPLADFSDGTVINGEVMKFEISNGSATSPVPEPSTYGIIGAVVLAALAWQRRRSGC